MTAPSNEALDAKAKLEAELGDAVKPAAEVKPKRKAPPKSPPKPSNYLARQVRLCAVRLEMARTCGAGDTRIAAYLRGAEAAFKLALQAQEGKGEANLELPPANIQEHRRVAENSTLHQSHQPKLEDGWEEMSGL